MDRKSLQGPPPSNHQTPGQSARKWDCDGYSTPEKARAAARRRMRRYRERKKVLSLLVFWLHNQKPAEIIEPFVDYSNPEIPTALMQEAA